MKVKPDVGEHTETVWLIDWKHPENNHFAIAEEVTVTARRQGARKRPDVVLYVNGIALGVLELKRSTSSVAEGIRQNLDNQKKEFIQPFFTTVQLVMAGNDTEGLRYGTIETPEKYYLTWKEDEPRRSSQPRSTEHLLQLCDKARFLELIHDFIVFDAGIKKSAATTSTSASRPRRSTSQRREGGIIWHTQGSGKSSRWCWLAKWIRENITDARVLIITDRDRTGQADREGLQRRRRGHLPHQQRRRPDRHAQRQPTPWLLCSLVHKFGGKDDDEDRRHRRLHRGAEEPLPPGLPGQGRPLRLRRRVPPHPVAASCTRR